MYQPYPSTDQTAGPLRPAVPAPVRTAVKLMHAGAAISIVPLIIALASIGDTNAYHLRWNGHTLTAAQLNHLRPLIITTAIVGGLVVPALWLWMARANGRGRNWARILSTVLFGLATLDLPTVFGSPIHFEVGVTEPGLVFVLTWLVGLAALWLLWRPASSAFFKPRDVTRAGSGAQLSSRMNASREQFPRHL
jgi:hypothetical protein